MSILDDLVRRPEWGARHAPGATLRLGQKTEMHVHHTVQKCPGPDQCHETLRSIEAQHERQWGVGIGYNLLWCHDRLYEGAGLLRRGAHCPNHNTSSWGVAFVGDGREPLPERLDDDLKRVWDELSNLRGIRLYLFGHRDHRATACPGDVLYHEVHNKFPSVGGAPPAPTPPPAPAPGGEPYDLEAVMQNPVIAEGSKSAHARIAQSLLIAHAADLVGDASRFVDGDFGARSAGVLRTWQGRTGVLVPDGVCGPKTWAWLCGLPVA